MCKYFTATDEFAVPTTQDMDPEHRGTRFMPGVMKAFVTIYEQNDDAHSSLPSLPTLREFLAKQDYAKPGLLTYCVACLSLAIDYSPFLVLSREYHAYRVGRAAW